MNCLKFPFRVLLVFSLIAGNSFSLANTGNAENQNLIPLPESSKTQEEKPSKQRIFTIRARVLVSELVSGDPEIKNTDIDALKQILEEQKLLIPDKRSLKRFLKGIKKSLKKYSNVLTHGSELNDHTRIEILDKIIDIYESEYSLKISRGDKKAIHYLEQILSSDQLGKKEVRLFRKALSAVGLPSHTHNEDFIKMYLTTRKMEKAQSWSNESQPTDKELFEILQQTKNNFDQMHYENLKNRTQFLNIVKGFPMQFILFQAAIGAIIYLEYFTDSYNYDAHTNPEPFSNFMDTLNPTAAFSFFVFIMVFQYTELGMYKLGLKWDNKFLKSASPSVGLASGFFASTLFQELATDVQLHQCVRTIVYPKPGDDGLHVSPCEHSYMEWIENKWKDYTVDIFTLLGASWLAHKIIRSIALLIRSTAVGEQLLSGLIRKIGMRAAGWTGFFITIFTFMEAHKILDKYIGQAAKGRLTLQSAKDNIFYLNQNLNALSWNTEDERIQQKIIKKIKSLGHKFQKWSGAQRVSYETAFYYWNLKTNKILTTYQGTYLLLESLFNESQKTTLDHYEENYANVSYYINEEKLTHERQDFIGKTCHYLEQHNWLDDQIPSWEQACKNPEDNVEIALLVMDARTIVYELLKRINKNQYVDFNSSYNYTFDLIQNSSESNEIKPIDYYLSNNIDEFFKNPIHNLSINQKLKLSEALLSSSIDSPFYSSKLKNQVQGEIYQSFCQPFLEEGEECEPPEGSIELLTHLFLVHKADLAGLYILKKTLGKNLKNIHTQNISLMKHVMSLFNPLKKGELLFANLSDSFQAPQANHSIGNLLASQTSSYSLISTLVCGTKRSFKNNFTPPQIFADLADDLCPLFPYAEDGKTKNSFFFLVDTYSNNKRLFGHPVTVRGQVYENSYLAIEDYIRNNFKTKEELFDFFKSQSQDQIQFHSEDVKQSLEKLTTDFFTPGLVNSEDQIKTKTQCADILAYYDITRSSTFKGMEISLYQIRFWIDKLRTVKNYDNEGFDEQAFDKTYCEVIELLKSYHDAFANNQTITNGDPEMLQSLAQSAEQGQEIDLSLLQEQNNEQNLVLIDRKILLHALLQKSYPDWNQFSLFIEGNYAMNHLSGNKQMAYAIVVELNKSLMGFFGQLSMLKMKDAFSDDIKVRDQYTQTTE